MSFGRILEHIVDNTYGARGAVFLDKDGEVVQSYLAPKTKAELEIIGAYHGITLSSCRKFSEEAEMGSIEVLICKYKDAICVIKTLNEGYFVLLLLSPQGNLGQAMYVLKEAAAEINAEMGI
ncbi:MAG: hypothetical protein RMM17_14090 [Acidobacteriota bacterium]|nr:hypothetical protein [Blastocatellia bacterium]MDW8413799.1 hypothetical protein [Acidobacteriota bacterium]